MKAIQSMINKSTWVMYNGYELQFLTIEDSDILTFKITYKTRDAEEKFIMVPKTDIDKFKKELLPVEQNDTGLMVSKHNDIIKQQNDTFLALSKGLLSDFDKVKEDPSYIAQAKQRSESVKTIIEMSKVQIDLIKTLR